MATARPSVHVQLTLFLAGIAIILIVASPNTMAQTSPHAQHSAQPSSSQFDKLVEGYFDSYFHFHPTAATATGFHQYDSQLEDYSRPSVEREVALLKIFQQKFAELQPSPLPQTAADLDLVRNHISGRLLELETIRSWENNPDLYSSYISNSVFVIMSRNFASPQERLRSVIARERQMPAVFDVARRNLKNPPRVYTEVALEQVPGIIGFFQKDVPQAFAQVQDAKLLAEFKTANDLVIHALDGYENFLREDLLPNSKGDFRIGAENFRKKLLYEEMVDIPLDRLVEIGMANLRHNQQWFRQVAAKIDPKRTPQQVLQELEKDHPPANQLLTTFRGVLGGLKDFIQQRHIISVPSQILPIVEDTPAFDRALTFASMDTPGAYEAKAKEAFFNVTVPEATQSPKQIEEEMAAFNRATIISTAVHEVYPGHYVQFLFLQQAPSKVRKLIDAASNFEGWAHYCEQMMLDEGYGKSSANGPEDVAFLKLRLGQLQDALLRNARYLVGLQMHTGRMTFDQGVDFFVQEGYQTRSVAQRETKRGTSDPTYLVYTLGKLEIMKLRDDYKILKGNQFNLQQFHDEFMRQGAVPVKIIRKAMLGNNSPVL